MPNAVTGGAGIRKAILRLWLCAVRDDLHNGWQARGRVTSEACFTPGQPEPALMCKLAE